MSAIAAAPPLRGQLVEIAPDRRLHIICAGPPAGARPTVLFESGAFGFSADWAAVQERLSAAGLRSCAYDRAGLGFSDPGPKPRDSLAIVSDLEKLLAASGETGPYILCGHSMAGLHLRVFAARNAPKVLGVVLVDAVTPEAMGALRTRQGVSQFILLARLAAWASFSGASRPLEYPLGDTIGLPPEAKAEKRWAFVSARHNHWSAVESAAWPVDANEAMEAGPFDPAWPVTVVLTGDAQSAGGRQATQSEPAVASRHGQVVYVPGSNHATLLGEIYGERIADAILQIEAVVAAKA
jgi:pimeloyl-ACP methyl ester carboxylesterase